MDKEKMIEIDKKIISLYERLTEKNKQQEKQIEEIAKIEYKENMQIIPEGQEFMGLEDNIYLVKKNIKDKDGNQKTVYEMYNENEEKIADIDEAGIVKFKEEYIQMLEEKFKGLYRQLGIGQRTITLKDLQEQNQEIEGVDLSKEEIKEKKEEQEKENDGKDEFEEQEEKEINQEELEKAYKKTGNTSNNIKACTQINPEEKITDSESFRDIVPDTKKYTKIYVVASEKYKNSNNKFHFVGVTKDQEVELIDSLEPTEGVNTGKTVININRDGSKVQEEQVSALFKVGNKDKGFSVTIGDYGIIETQYFRRTKDNDYISTDINSTTQKPTTLEVKEFMSDTRNPYMQDNVDLAKNEIKEKDETKIENIDDNVHNDVIVDDIDKQVELSTGEVTTIRKEAQKLNMSIEEYEQAYNKTDEKEMKEKILEVREKKIEVEEREDDEKQRTPWGDAQDRMNKRF